VKQGAGADLYAMSIQNEPDFSSANYPTTLFTNAEYMALVKVAGPKLHALNPPTAVLGPESLEWLHLWTNKSATGSADPLNGNYDYCHALYQDAEAWAQIDIIGTHQYETQVAEPWPSDVPRTKPLWMTEMSGIRGWPEGGPSTTIDNGIAVAGWIHDAIVNGLASAWCWWWYNGGSDTNEGLLLNGQDTKRHYTLGNFSRFIRPGFARVDITGNIPADVLFSAYKDAGGAVVIVAINKGNAPTVVPISITGGKNPDSLTPWVTSANDNLKSGAAVTVSGGAFTATLDGKTVTTFFGK
jgi:glucuronoarabinoxylan endo-1,4-beta-xylanase